MLDHTASQQAWLVEVVVGVRGGRDWRCAGDRMVKVLTTVYSPVLVVTVSSSSHQTDCGCDWLQSIITLSSLRGFQGQPITNILCQTP